MNIYVGNLSYSVTEEDLNAMFAEFGDVTSAKLIMDRDSGRSKGFGFVEMSGEDAGQKAIDELNGRDVGGRSLTVNKARPREERPRGGGGGGRGGGVFIMGSGFGGGSRPPIQMWWRLRRWRKPLLRPDPVTRWAEQTSVFAAG